MAQGLGETHHCLLEGNCLSAGLVVSPLVHRLPQRKNELNSISQCLAPIGMLRQGGEDKEEGRGLGESFNIYQLLLQPMQRQAVKRASSKEHK